MKEVSIINSRRHYISMILKYFFGFLFMSLFGLIFTRGSSTNLMQNLNFPLYLRNIITIVWIISFILTFWGIFLHHKGKITADILFDKIVFSNTSNELFLNSVQKVRLLLNPHPGKPVYYREITSFGGNNWLEIEEQNGEKHRFEFLIRSEKQEKEILELVEKWRENGLTVEVGKSPKMFWEIFM